MESKSDAELVQEFYPTLESDYSQIKNSTWQEENKEALGLVDTGLKILAGIALAAGTVMTGGAGLPLALAGGAYLFADGAHSAITGNTLITGTQLSTEERIWAGAEAVVTLATLGSFAAGQGALRAGKQIPTTVQTIGKLAGYADEGVELGQLASGILSGDGTNATLNYIGGKAFEGIVEGSVKGLQSQLSHIEVSSPSQIQLNARQGQDFVDLQTVEFGKIASKVENNITIKMTVDGVEQKIRVDAIGFDEAGNIRIQEYTTAQSGLKSSRQNLLEDLSKYGGTIVGGVEIPKGTRIDVVSQKTGNFSIDSTPNYIQVGRYTAELSKMDLPLEEKVIRLQEFYSDLSDKTDINVPSDPQYVVAVRDGWVEYDWPENLGYQEGTVQSITRELGLPDQWDRFGHMGGGNFSDIPSDGPYTYSQRAIPYVENPNAYHKGTFNRQTYFDKIDAIADNDIETLNSILEREGLEPVSKKTFDKLYITYNDFISNTTKSLNMSMDSVRYGVHGKAAAWGDMSGGAEQIVTPFGGTDMLGLRMMEEN
ncbi:TPA: hypothetical protein ACHV9L_000428 [Streptococcus suis]|uniref:hypothetical protein n=1 Tax=Streptococcus suis TaxID=1307 RepID=UPI000CF37A91|nr:hypothetical protein [Streptococcus suis]HEM6072109.1 hypothetical protein [Streptococcus suis]